MSSVRQTIGFSLTFSFCILIIHVTSSIPIHHQQRHIRNSLDVGGESIIRMRRNMDFGDHTHPSSHIYSQIPIPIPIYIHEKNENAANKQFDIRDVHKNQQHQQQQSENAGERTRRQMPPTNEAEYRYSRDTVSHDRNRRSSELNNNIVKQSAESRTQNQNRDSNKRTKMISNNNLNPSQSQSQLPSNYANFKPKLGTQFLISSQSQSQDLNKNAASNYSSTSATSSSSPSTTSVVVVNGLSKYSVLHLVPPTGSQVHEIQNSLDDPQQRYALNTNKKNSDSVSEKTGLVIVLIEFDVLDGEDDTYETKLETVDY